MATVASVSLAITEPWRRFKPSGSTQISIEGISCQRDEQLQTRPRSAWLRCFAPRPTIQDDDAGEKQTESEPDSEVARPKDTKTSEPRTSYTIGSGPLEVLLHTMGGQELRVSGCVPTTTLGDVKEAVQEMLLADADELKLLHNGDIIESCEQWSSQSLSDRGLDAEGASLAVLRMCSGERLTKLLSKAIERGDDAEARDLIDRGAGLDADGKPMLYMGSSMLHLALRARLQDFALFLIHSGADIHASNEMGREPLAVAAMKGLGRLVTVLLDAGANPHHKDRVGMTAINHGETHFARACALKDGCLEDLYRLAERA